uniref:Uncharacterized protein n=1 Tax=Dunaliella tertiolecta TaxID=3047 RepID=A0A7S3QUX3_DUNTE
MLSSVPLASSTPSATASGTAAPCSFSAATSLPTGESKAHLRHPRRPSPIWTRKGARTVLSLMVLDSGPREPSDSVCRGSTLGGAGNGGASVTLSMGPCSASVDTADLAEEKGSSVLLIGCYLCMYMAVTNTKL